MHNHFSKDPPIERQIEIMTSSFRHAARVAEGSRDPNAFENHLDYRASEIARVIEAVNSPALRANFDTGNPVGIIEDPVDAAKAVACYTVMPHLKDFRIQPLTGWRASHPLGTHRPRQHRAGADVRSVDVYRTLRMCRGELGMTFRPGCGSAQRKSSDELRMGEGDLSCWR